MLGGGDSMPPSPIVNHLVRTVTGDGSRGASRDPFEHSKDTGDHMTTLSLGQAAGLTGRDRDAWREQAQTRLLPAPASAMSWWRWLRTTG